jgi:alpha-ketoglutarate-dependent 2,4-dichlorophenoxyacetate dioxygenase
VNITPLHQEFGAEITAVDLSQTLSDQEFAAIDRAINQYSVLLFRDQQLDDAGHIAFTRRFGSLEEGHVNYYSHGKITYVGRIGNIDADGNRLTSRNQRVRSQTGNEMWHSDSSFREIPCLYSLLYAYEVPPQGGDTEFVSARAAYQRLDETTRATLDPLIGIHDYIFSRTKVSEDAVNEGQRTFMRPVRQRLVRRNPVTGEKNIFIGSHVRSIEGWPDEQARPLLDRLLNETTRAESIYRHHWQVGDLLLWDNRCVLHRGCGYDADRFRRRLHQTRVRCPGPSLAEHC